MKIWKNALTPLFLLLPCWTHAQNRPVPAGIPSYEFTRFDHDDHGYYLTAPFKLGAAVPGGPTAALMLLDADGYLVWYQQPKAVNLLDFKYDPVNKRYMYVRFRAPNDLWFMVLDTGFQLVDSFTTVNGWPADVHDFQVAAGPSYVLPGVSDSVMDLSAYQFNGMPGSAQTHVTGFVVQEFDTAQQLTFQWNSNDFIAPTEAYGFYGYAPGNFDYCHGNSIEVAPDGDFLVSFRHLNAVYKIRRSDGSVAWRLGGKSSSFAFPNDLGFSGQHDVRWLPNGHITMFDNANMTAPPRRSRAVEYELDTVNWVATRVWQYRYQPGFFSSALGGHQTTAERLHLINYGLNYRPNPSFVLTDDDQNLLSALFFQDSVMSYRSSLFDVPFDTLQRPQIQCTRDSGTVILSAPPGMDRYEWSTGEHGPAIALSGPGTYQCWVGAGAGMFGSKPFVVADLSEACPLSGTAEPEGGSARPTVSGYCDVLGRQVLVPEPGQLVVVRYRDGRSVLRLWR